MALLPPSSRPACRQLVLDAGPLLSLQPLRGLAETFLTVPHVLDELKDNRAREHFNRLGLVAGVQIKVQEPDAASLAHVIQFSKKTGDYSVLSHADLCVLALTYALDLQCKAEEQKKSLETSEEAVTAESTPASSHTAVNVDTSAPIPTSEQSENVDASDSLEEVSSEVLQSDPTIASDVHDCEQEPLDVTLEHLDIGEESEQNPEEDLVSNSPEPSTLFEDPSDEDDGEGEWITPSNVDYHKSVALDLLPSQSDTFTTVKSKKSRMRTNGSGSRPNVTNNAAKEQVGAGCMTADFAMQNVLLQMGLNLVGVDGKRIEKVKTWVLRCHACFKICKDSSKKFCPSCGGATLLRTSVSTSSPTANSETPAMQVHLKRNYTYRNRGTIYSIPLPKPGSSKKGTGEGLILREDQTEYLRAKKHEEGRKAREEKKMVQGALTAGKDGGLGVRAGSWMDPDWMPEMLSVGTGGKGRTTSNSRVQTGPDGMPIVGYGKKNPNERRKRK